MDFNTILQRMIQKDPTSPLAILFDTLGKKKVKLLLNDAKSLFTLPTKEEIKQKVLELLRKYILPEVIEKFRERAWNVARSATGGYVIFTYLPIFIITIGVLLILYFNKKITIIQTVMIFLLVLLVLFFFTIVIFAVARSTVLNLFRLEVLADQLTDIIVGIKDLGEDDEAAEEPPMGGAGAGTGAGGGPLGGIVSAPVIGNGGKKFN